MNSTDAKESLKLFRKEVALFERILKSYPKVESPVKRLIRLMRNRQNVKNYYRRHGQKKFTFNMYPPKCGEEKVGKTVFRDVMTNHSDELLCLTGKDLEVMVKEFGIDPNLPTKKKQEEVFIAALDRISLGESERKKIAKRKQPDL